jgi:hypothetical protein
MRILNIGGVPTSLGELLNLRGHLDTIKHNYDQIRLGPYKKLWQECLHVEAPDWPEKEKLWNKMMDDLGALLFSEHPYIIDPNPSFYGGDMGVLSQKLGIRPQRVHLAHLLCKGTPLDIGQYIVITTKARQVVKKRFMPIATHLWQVISRLSDKYKIVILGERKVEMRKEYGVYDDGVFGIYDHIIANVPNANIVDLTVPALGETVSDLTQIQQDCLIMNQAEFVVTIGIGGNFCLSTSCAKMSIVYRDDALHFSDRIFGNHYQAPDAFITKNYGSFIDRLGQYC